MTHVLMILLLLAASMPASSANFEIYNKDDKQITIVKIKVEAASITPDFQGFRSVSLAAGKWQQAKVKIEGASQYKIDLVIERDGKSYAFTVKPGNKDSLLTFDTRHASILHPETGRYLGFAGKTVSGLPLNAKTNVNQTEIIRQSTLEPEMKRLASAAEEISNTAKNLMDVFSLRLSEGQAPERLADDFISALGVASKTVPPMSSFSFAGKTTEVAEKNRPPMAKLNVYFQGGNKEEWRAALIDYIANKAAAAKGAVHIAKPLLVAIQQMRTEYDAAEIAFYLMAEITKTGGGTRSIDVARFKAMLDDSRIKKLPKLAKAVVEAAKGVQLRAIRKEQSNVVWDLRNGLNKASRQAFDQKLAELGSSTKDLDFEGVKKIARSVGIATEKLKATNDLNKVNDDFRQINR